MKGFLLIIPFFIIRFGILAFMNKEALNRAALFAPINGNEKIAYIFYQLSNLVIIFYPIFLKIEFKEKLSTVGFIIYVLGLILLFLSALNFSKPKENGINTNGIYKLSRNPMYVSYYICFLGCVILTNSLVLLGTLIIFVFSSHWIIRSEERWCIDKFGKEYINYMNKVRRYI